LKVAWYTTGAEILILISSSCWLCLPCFDAVGWV